MVWMMCRSFYTSVHRCMCVYIPPTHVPQPPSCAGVGLGCAPTLIPAGILSKVVWPSMGRVSMQQRRGCPNKPECDLLVHHCTPVLFL